MTFVFMLPRVVYNNTSVSMTWEVQDTFYGLSLCIKTRKLALTQWKYALDMLQDIGLLGRKQKTSHIEALSQFWDTSSPLLKDANHYRDFWAS